MVRRKPRLRFYMMLVSYLLLLYIILIPMSNMVYNRCFVALRDMISDSQRTLTEQTARKLDQEIASLQRMAMSISTNDFFAPYRLNNGGYDSYLAQQELCKMRMGNDLLADVWYYPIASNAKNLMYTADTAFPFIGFFDQRCRIQGENSETMLARFQALKAGTLLLHQRITGLKSAARDYALYMYPIRDGASVSAVMTFAIEQDDLNDVLTTALAGNNGYVGLLSRDGGAPLLWVTQGELPMIAFDPVTADVGREGQVYEEQLNGSEYTFVLSSEISGRLRLLTVTPNSQLFERVYGTRTFYTVALCLMLMLLTCGCYALTVYNYRPVARLTKSITSASEELGQSRDEFENVTRYIHRLLQENHSYQQTAAFHELVEREQEDGPAAQGDAAAIGLENGHDAYAALLMYMDACEYRDARLMPMLMENIAQQAGFAQAFCFPYSVYDDRTFAMLVAADGEACAQKLEKLVDMARRMVNAQQTITVGAGEIKEACGQIAQSFFEAREALYCAMMRGQETTVHYGELNRRPDYNYPYPQEQNLLSAIKRGAREDIPQAVEEICAYIREHADSRDQVRYLCQGVTQSAVRLLFEMKADFSVLEEMQMFVGHPFETVEAFARRLTQFCMLLMESLENRPVQTLYSPLADQAALYIRGHFADPDCTVESVASFLGSSQSHLTRIFKERFDCTIVQYIDNLRMEKAREALCETSEKIGSIIAQCGFTSESNFIRKFKKLHGITPMQYRMLYQQNADAGSADEGDAPWK